MNKTEQEMLKRLQSELERSSRKIKKLQDENHKLRRELEVAYDYYQSSDDTKQDIKSVAMEDFE